VSAYGLQIEIIPVDKPGTGGNPAPDMLRSHAIRDAAVLAESYGLSFPRDVEPPAEDRVRRAHAVLLQRRSSEAQLEIAHALGEAVWRSDGAALAALVQQHGGISGETVRPALEANYAALERAGHYQPGMLNYGGDWYWGLDRLVHLEQRLHREGLEGSTGLTCRDSSLLASMIREPNGVPGRIEAFVSFRSPYSYLALPQLIELRDRHGVEVAVRPVLPMVMRGLPVPRAKKLYIAHDAKREADRLGIPFGHVCDPLGRGIGNCMAVFFNCAIDRGLELDFVHSVGRGAWSEARDIGDMSDFLELAGRAGIDETDVRQALRDRTWKDQALQNREALTELGLWGVPSLRIGSFSTWGQDRIPMIGAEIARFSKAA
jgi:2-hydroxychromene-2-carboxylate isomerase